jgi:hypothetical protein
MWRNVNFPHQPVVRRPRRKAPRVKAALSPN